MNKTRPPLHAISLAEALENILMVKPGVITVTMSLGQWDTILAVAYDQGCVLLELDDGERPVAAYQREGEQ